MLAATPTVVPVAAPAAPAVRGAPLVGVLPSYLPDPLGFLRRAAREHGPVVTLRFPRLQSFLVSDPALIEQVFVARHRSFTKDWFLRDLRRVLGDGLLTSEGDHWLRQRRLMQPAFHRERVAAYADTMVECAERLLATWRDGEGRDVHDDMMALTLEIVARTLFSADVADTAADVAEAVEAVMRRYARPLTLLVPALERLPLPENERFRAATRRLDEIIFGLIARRRASSNAGATDLLATLLAARDEDGSRMSDRQVRDEVMTLFLAGHETTALALSWTWYLLAQYPRVERRLGEELDAALGGRAPTLEDLPRLRYAEAVVTEAMRLYPPVWSLGREAVEPVPLGPYVVPAGAQVWASQWVVHHDPTYFPDPDTFRPERWEDGLARRLPRYAYFPFGGGPRLCIGQAFAQMEAVLLLATLAQRFRFALVPGQPVEPFPSITLRPRRGIKVRLRARARG